MSRNENNDTNNFWNFFKSQLPPWRWANYLHQQFNAGFKNLTDFGVSSWECRKPEPFLKSGQNKIFYQFLYFHLRAKLGVNTSLNVFVALQRLRVFLDSLMMLTDILDPNRKALLIDGCIIWTVTFCPNFESLPIKEA